MLYTDFPMSHWKLFLRMVVMLSLFVSAAHSYAAQRPYGKGVLKDIQEKTREKVDMYLVNTPVTSLVPYFQVAVDLGDTTYLAEYTPRRAGEELPEAWKVGETVACKADKHHLYLQRPDGTEMQFSITKKTPISPKQSKE
jgi:hypothetical protein